MDLIYECAAKFILLERYEYKFVVSRKRKTREIILNFSDKDFFHLAGLHYLTDISIPRNRKDILKIIIEKKKINLHSNIDAEYIIESRLPGARENVYIFLKRREECPETYCVASFFKKGIITYGGEAL